MELSLVYDPTSESSRILARHWCLTVRDVIPDRLEYAARLLGDAVDLAYRYELGEAFAQPRDGVDVIAEDLASAARRIREAARYIDVPEAQ